MRRTALTCKLALTAAIVCGEGGAAESSATSAGNGASRQVRELVDRMSRAVAELEDYTCIFSTQEFVDGEMQPVETLSLKQRKTPRCAYMKWLKGRHKDREAIHCEARYDAKLKVREGSGIARLLGTLSLDPHGSLAMKGNRHAVTEIGVFHPVEMVAKDLALAERHPEHGARVEGVEKRVIEGEPSLCWTSIRPAEQSGYYAPRSHVCAHETLGLPTLIESWDASGQLLERYTWSDFETNVGLSDADFDVDNEAYGF
ncbi:MAG: DUF1571 domain-containing protein [Candidatus Binatia bacterium]